MSTKSFFFSMRDGLAAESEVKEINQVEENQLHLPERFR